MKFCKNCSASLEDDAVFCTECGASLANDSFTSSGNLDGQSDNYEGFQGSIPSGSSDSEYSSDSSYSSNNNYSSNNDYSSNTGYSQPQTQYGAPQGKNPGTPWLIVSIVALFCCSSIFAIPGLIFAIISTTSFNAGNIQDAEQKANTSKILSIIGIVLGVIINIVVLVVIFSTGAYSYY